jgi:hypothetical protein
VEEDDSEEGFDRVESKKGEEFEVGVVEED